MVGRALILACVNSHLQNAQAIADAFANDFVDTERRPNLREILGASKVRGHTRNSDARKPGFLEKTTPRRNPSMYVVDATRPFRGVGKVLHADQSLAYIRWVRPAARSLNAIDFRETHHALTRSTSEKKRTSF